MTLYKCYCVRQSTRVCKKGNVRIKLVFLSRVRCFLEALHLGTRLQKHVASRRNRVTRFEGTRFAAERPKRVGLGLSPESIEPWACLTDLQLQDAGEAMLLNIYFLPVGTKGGHGRENGRKYFRA